MNGVPRRPGWFYRWMMAFLGLFDRWLHLSCRAFIQLASEKYERPLRRGERMRQAFHRGMCRLCRVQERHMDQLRTLARDVGQEVAEIPDVKLSPEATERTRRAMAEAAETSGAPDS